jgi:Zn-dependent peptidase ImmA (M78 family)
LKLPPQTFRNILTARGLPLSSLAARTGYPEARLRSIVDGEADLEDEEVETLADELAVPMTALFAHNRLPLFPPVDFRTAHPGVREFNKGTLSAISFIERLSSTLASIDMDVSLDRSLGAVSTDYSDAEAIRLAGEWRTRWGVTVDEQLGWHDANKLYASLRGFIEGLGVVVVHRSFDSDEAAGIYMHVDAGPHVIVINTTRSSKARKLFTLAHEFCHVLLRAEGASNPSILKNRVERFCNKFAAYLLAPAKLIWEAIARFGYRPSADEDFIRLFARRLGISQEALVVRLVEEKILDRSDYAHWRSRFNGVTPPGDTGDGGGGQSDPLQVKRTTYGTRLLKLLETAKRTGKLDEIDIFRLSGLKPVYQAQLFETL